MQHRAFTPKSKFRHYRRLAFLRLLYEGLGGGNISSSFCTVQYHRYCFAVPIDILLAVAPLRCALAAIRNTTTAYLYYFFLKEVVRALRAGVSSSAVLHQKRLRNGWT
jgi:hypothetical protein